MLHYGFPLSRAESDFAAEHHDLVFSYLSQAELPADDFYDIAVFGYLQAVRRYLARPELRRYGFSAVAFRAMGLSVRRSGNIIRSRPSCAPSMMNCTRRTPPTRSAGLRERTLFPGTGRKADRHPAQDRSAAL